MSDVTESEIEIFSLDKLKQLGFSYIPGHPLRPSTSLRVHVVMLKVK